MPADTGWNDRKTLRTAEQKAERIEENRWPASGEERFSAPELIALGLSNTEPAIQRSLRNPELRLNPGRPEGSALVNFDQLRKGRNKGNEDESWLLSKLFTGEHAVTVVAQIESGNGSMTVRPEKVSVDGVSVSGSALTFLINNFVLPHYPSAVINRPFTLYRTIERVTLEEGSAVVIRRGVH